MKVFRLQSSPMCFAPGLIKFAINLAITNKGQAKELLSAWDEDERLHARILAGEYIVKDDVVIVPVEDDPNVLVGKLESIMEAFDQDIYFDNHDNDPGWQEKLDAKDTAFSDMREVIDDMKLLIKARSHE